jgi:hypothetical protein
MNSDKSPMPMHVSPRCSATSKRTGGPCKAPAVTGWSVCRCHGAGGGAPKGARNGNYRHGRFTCEAIAQKQEMSAWIKAMARFAKQVA